MRKTTVKELSLAGFQNYGVFANLINPKAYFFGAPPIQFFRDILQLNLGGASIASFSICRVSKRPAAVTVTEYHSSCGEGILPLDGDVLIHVGPASRSGALPLEEIEIFRVPKGTLVCLKPGVFHHAPFTQDQDVVNVLIVLPERTYAEDCNVFEIPEDRQIEF